VPLPQIIVVVGAGASNAAAALPTGKETAQFLRDEMTKGFGPAGERLIADEIDRLALQFNLDEGDFETILFALSKFNKPTLLQRLGSVFGRRYHPWLGYEILAHCLKHRFIDAIINFNFDEILDQSIMDEVGEGGFHKISWMAIAPTRSRILSTPSSASLLCRFILSYMAPQASHHH
jgi:hypothetical protein